MNKYYFTFGQIHSHVINGVTLDKDSVLLINAETEGAAREFFINTTNSTKWAFTYSEVPEMEYFPRGIVLELTVYDFKPGVTE